jgi:hypothetical protein
MHACGSSWSRNHLNCCPCASPKVPHFALPAVPVSVSPISAATCCPVEAQRSPCIVDLPLGPESSVKGCRLSWAPHMGGWCRGIQGQSGGLGRLMLEVGLGRSGEEEVGRGRSTAKCERRIPSPGTSTSRPCVTLLSPCALPVSDRRGSSRTQPKTAAPPAHLPPLRLRALFAAALACLALFRPQGSDQKSAAATMTTRELLWPVQQPGEGGQGRPSSAEGSRPRGPRRVP